MSTVVENAEKERKLMVKGAPEQVIERCTFFRQGDKAVAMTAAVRKALLDKVANWGGEEALRVLAFAVVEKPTVKDLGKIQSSDYAKIEVCSSFLFFFLTLI